MFFLNILPESFPHATIEPVKAIAPIAMVSPSAAEENTFMLLSVIY